MRMRMYAHTRTHECPSTPTHTLTCHTYSIVTNASESHCPLTHTISLCRYCCPDLRDRERVISIVDGRHPLVELTVSPFVVNSTELDEETRVQIVTGANASGKSVYLKQVSCALQATPAKI
jgi:DNA mismatch repair ATPase MutS